MDLEGIMLSELSQTKTNTVWSHLMWNIKHENKKWAHRYREQMDGYQKLEWGWVGEMGEVGQKVQASSYK